MPTQYTRGPQRHLLSAPESLRNAAMLPLFRDEGRRRPLYFDGRFLAARDLTREQDYVLARQADLCRAGGFGVVSGLQVAVDPKDANNIVVSAGLGVTPGGELVIISDQVSLDLTDVTTDPALSARMGIARLREPAARRRSGLYVVALRAVEFDAGPVARYPTTLDGQRATHNGDIVEATIVTLIPYPDRGDPTELAMRRAHAAKEIFVDRVNPGVTADALPIAMIALDIRGNLLWVDQHLVRREVGAEAGDILGVSGAPLALREAFLLQYEAHLRAVVAAPHASLVASQHFLALPPAGLLPAAAIDRRSFTQRFFPADVDVDLSIIPSDELGALLEEARMLPPIDLTAPDELRSTSVLVLVPVDRADLDPARARLAQVRRVLKPTAPNLLAGRPSLDRLAMLPLIRRPAPSVTTSADDETWRRLLADPALDLVWYVRRRNMPAASTLVAEVVGRTPNDLLVLVRGLAAYGLTLADAHRVDEAAWRSVGPHVTALGHPLLRAAAIAEIARNAPPTDTEDAAAEWAAEVVRRHTIDPALAKHLLRIFTPRAATATLLRSGLTPDLVAPLERADNTARTAWETSLTAAEATPAPLARDTAIRARLIAALSITRPIRRPVNP